MKLQLLAVWIAFCPICACLDCYVEISTPDSGQINWNMKPNSLSDYYTPLINQGVDPATQSVWYFDIKSCGRSGILLTTNSDLSDFLFDIVLGSYSNTKIVVWTGPNNPQEYETGPNLNCTAFTRFWLNWTPDGTVQLGAGTTEGLDTYFTASKLGASIGGIGVNSGFGSNGVWRYGIPSSLQVPETCSTTQTTEQISPTPDSTFQSTDLLISDCIPTPTILRPDKTVGYFKKDTSMQLSALNHIGTSTQCSLLSCAHSCLSNSGCWYYRFDTTVSGCQSCLLFDSSSTSCLETGPVDIHLYMLV